MHPHGEETARRQRMHFYSGHVPPPGNGVAPVHRYASGPAIKTPVKHRFHAAYGSAEVGERRIAPSDLERLAMPKGLVGAVRFLPPVRGAVETEPSVRVPR